MNSHYQAALFPFIKLTGMTIKAKRLRCFCAMLIICITASCFGQDTVKLTLPQTENIFLQKNLSLLAEKYNIDIARAQIIQAGLYNNPNLLFTGNIYNPDRKKALDISNRTGQYSVEANQLITLAGKRNKQIQLAQTNAAISENNFLEVLRTLRYVLRTDF